MSSRWNSRYWIYFWIERSTKYFIFLASDLDLHRQRSRRICRMSWITEGELAEVSIQSPVLTTRRVKVKVDSWRTHSNFTLFFRFVDWQELCLSSNTGNFRLKTTEEIESPEQLKKERETADLYSESWQQQSSSLIKTVLLTQGWVSRRRRWCVQHLKWIKDCVRIEERDVEKWQAEWLKQKTFSQLLLKVLLSKDKRRETSQKEGDFSSLDS